MPIGAEAVADHLAERSARAAGEPVAPHHRVPRILRAEVVPFAGDAGAAARTPRRWSTPCCLPCARSPRRGMPHPRSRHRHRGIAIALLAEVCRKRRRSAIDISARCAGDRAPQCRANGVVGPASGRRSDWFEPLDRAAFHVIVSNPPYIETDELATLQARSQGSRSATALDGGADGLEAYRMIAAQAPGIISKPAGSGSCRNRQHAEAGCDADLFAGSRLRNDRRGKKTLRVDDRVLVFVVGTIASGAKIFRLEI